MEQKQLKYTIKIYGEGYTEWFYFDQLRATNKFKFTIEPDMPNGSRSSYKKRLKLIDQELKKRPQERANAIFLITDLDNIQPDKKALEEYLSKKAAYKAKGVQFIESHPCIELWFLYHFWDKFEKSVFRTYDEMKSVLRKVLPSYDKSTSYYLKNKQFKDCIMQDAARRRQAVSNGIKSCKYETAEGEICNYSEMFKAIHFFRLLKEFCELDSIIKERKRTSVNLSLTINDHKALTVSYDNRRLCQFKYDDKGKLHLNTNCSDSIIPDDEPLAYESKDIDTVLALT